MKKGFNLVLDEQDLIELIRIFSMKMRQARWCFLKSTSRVKPAKCSKGAEK